MPWILTAVAVVMFALVVTVDLMLWSERSRSFRAGRYVPLFVLVSVVGLAWLVLGAFLPYSLASWRQGLPVVALAASVLAVVVPATAVRAVRLRRASGASKRQ